MKCFLDANVLFSAANKSSQMHRLILRLSENHSLITSDYAREEAIRNIRAKRSDWKYGFATVMVSVNVVQSIDRAIDGLEIAQKDRPILATAIAENCERLITGDKRDFGHLFQTTVHGVIILTPHQFAEELSR